jgi:hypothetical protein
MVHVKQVAFEADKRYNNPMATENEAEVQISARVSNSTYAKIQDRQKLAKQLTGIEPSISAVVRAMIEEAAANVKSNGRRR